MANLIVANISSSMMILNNDLMINTATTRLITPWRLDVAKGIVMRLSLHRIRDGHANRHGDDPLALDEHLAILATATAVSARAG